MGVKERTKAKKNTTPTYSFLCFFSFVMGKWVEKGYDSELVRKMKALFEEVSNKLNREQPDLNFTFENFVESFDETDKFNRRLFEFFVKVTPLSLIHSVDSFLISSDCNHFILVIIIIFNFRKLRNEDCEGAMAWAVSPAHMATLTCMLPAAGTLRRATTPTFWCPHCHKCQEVEERSMQIRWSRKLQSLLP